MESLKSLFVPPSENPNYRLNRHDYQNQRIVGRNKLQAHPPAYCFSSEEEALQGHLEEESPLQTSTCIVLTDPSKKWDFNFATTPSECPPVMDEYGGFLVQGDRYYSWTTISVPSNWECEGFGQAVYTNFQYPFKVEVTDSHINFKLIHAMILVNCFASF